MSLTVPPQGYINLTTTFSPIYWGFVMSLFLGGITIVQAYIYFPRSKDRLAVQAIAMTMLVLDLVSSALVAQSVFYYLIPYFGSLAPLGSVTPELSAECLISGIITFISQMYFVYQLNVVKQLGRIGHTAVIFVAFCTFVTFAGGVGCVASMIVYHHGVLSNRNRTFSIFFAIAKGFGALTDIIATVCMSLYLKSSQTGIAQTNQVLKRLIQFVVQRGALVTLIQFLLLVTFLALPNDLTWFAFHVNVTKLYANTFFAMLNGREHLKQQHAAGTLKTSFVSSSRSRGHAAEEQGSYDLDLIDSQRIPRDVKPPLAATSLPTNAINITKTVVISDM